MSQADSALDGGRYQRVILKISGEGFAHAGERGRGETLSRYEELLIAALRLRATVKKNA